ncbi:hypothetical protein BHM03_00038860 [Ensete ventricosum]|nr:hypothetical protein BHM03_00038860 [Ensete ventricosum]
MSAELPQFGRDGVMKVVLAQGRAGLLQGAERVLRMLGEGGGQEAHRDSQRRPALPRSVQGRPRRVRRQVPSHLGIVSHSSPFSPRSGV